MKQVFCLIQVLVDALHYHGWARGLGVMYSPACLRGRRITRSRFRDRVHTYLNHDHPPEEVCCWHVGVVCASWVWCVIRAQLRCSRALAHVDCKQQGSNGHNIAAASVLVRGVCVVLRFTRARHGQMLVLRCCHAVCVMVAIIGALVSGFGLTTGAGAE